MAAVIAIRSHDLPPHPEREPDQATRGRAHAEAVEDVGQLQAVHDASLFTVALRPGGYTALGKMAPQLGLGQRLGSTLRGRQRYLQTGQVRLYCT